MDKIIKRALKLFKQNIYTVHEVAEICGVDQETLEREFRKQVGDQFFYPGIFLVGDWVDKIADAVKKWDRVLVLGDPGVGKSINAIHAAKKVSDKVGRAWGLRDLERMYIGKFPGVVFVDDAESMGKKWKEVLEKAPDGMRIIATASKNTTLKGYHVIRIKPPSRQEMQDLAAAKGWVMVKGARNLVDLAKANSYGGGFLDLEDPTPLKEVRSILRGEGSRHVNKTVIEQVARNAIEMDSSPDKIDEVTRACAAAWLMMMAGGNPSPLLSTFSGAKGAACIMFRRWNDG